MIFFWWRGFRYFLLRGCVILCVERLHDFCMVRGCMIFLRFHDFSHSLRLHDFLFLEVA